MSQNSKAFIYFCLAIILIIIAGFRPIGLDPDSIAYSGFVEDFKGLGSIDMMDKEPGFWLLLAINHFLFDRSVTAFLSIYAILSVSIKLSLFRKLSLYPFLTVILYISSYYILQDMNQIRIGLACAILLWSLQDVIDRNAKSFLLKIILATTFHYSAIVGFFFYFFKTRRFSKTIYLIAPLICSFFLFFKNKIFECSVLFASYLPGFLSAKVNTYVMLQKEGVFAADNLLIYNYGTIIIFSMLLFFTIFTPAKSFKVSYRLQTLLVKILSLQLVLGETLSFNSELSNRFFTLLGFVAIPLLFPNILRYVQPKWLATLIIVLYAIRQLYSSVTGVFLF